MKLSISKDPLRIGRVSLRLSGSDLGGKEDANLNAVKAPMRRSFEEFLLNDARVPVGRGVYQPYSFQGREALLAVVRVIDKILGSAEWPNLGLARVRSANNSPGPQDGGMGSSPSPRPSPPRRGRSCSSVLAQIPARIREGSGAQCGNSSGSPLSDAELCLAGGAQFGKTLLELNLAAYLTGQQFRNFGLYLPDDDLVEGIVDSKFRPDVVDQIDWFAKMTQVGKALNRSGKAVNRKGAFLVTDGRRKAMGVVRGLGKAMGVVRGLGKVPTAFSMDVAAMDELDDLQPRRMKFVRGRLAASDLRFVLKLGTQRIHGRGMNLAWKDGSQGVFTFVCPNCGRMHCAEEEFPQIIRLRDVEALKGEALKRTDTERGSDCQAEVRPRSNMASQELSESHVDQLNLAVTMQ